MADQIQLAMIKKGVQAWNNWRAENASEDIDLNDANLSGADLSGCNLSGAWLKNADLSNAKLKNTDIYGANLENSNFTKADLSGANLQTANINATIFAKAILHGANLFRSWGENTNFQRALLGDVYLYNAILRRADFSESQSNSANFTSADFTDANFKEAHLIQCNLSHSILKGADFTLAYMVGADFKYADMEGADLSEANLQEAVLVKTNLENAILRNAYIYGISVWDIKGTPKDQSSLVITHNMYYLFFKDRESDFYKHKKGAIRVDDLQVAQFIYLLLNRKNLRNLIDTITSKAVLILGRFTPERKKILDAMADELRKNNLLPIIFDFEKPTDRDFTETIKTLAGISLFIIADITSPKSSPLELQAVVPDYQIPLVPIIQADEQPFSMLSDLIGKYDWVLPKVITYTSVDQLKAGFKKGIIDRAWQKHQELQKKKTATIETQSIEDFIQKNIE